MKTFRFGINLRDAKSRADWQDKARKVEALGYSALLVPDHLAPMLATVPAVVSAADATTVPLPVSGTREGDTKIAPPSSIVDPDVTERLRFIGHAAIAAIRAATGV